MAERLQGPLDAPGAAAVERQVPPAIVLESGEQARVRAQLVGLLFGPRRAVVGHGEDAINVGALAKAIGMALVEQAVKK